MAHEKVNDPLRYDSAAMNAAVARIAGVSKKVFEDKSQPMTESRRQVAEVSDREDPGPDHKAFAPRSSNSLDQKAPSHQMPSKKAAMEQPGTDGYDDEEDTVAKPEQGAQKESAMDAVVKATGLSSVEEWRTLAGLTPMYESADRGTGEVPTAGVKKQNKTKGGGLPGLEGQSVQEIEPKGYGDDGADSEETFDQAPGDLKKESYNHFFPQFLEERGLTLDVFNELVDEAMESNDVEEMDALLAVESIFGKWMDKKQKTNPEHQKNMALLQRTKSAVQAKKAGKLDTYGRQKKVAAEEELAFECDDDGAGNPDWKKAFSKMKRGR